MGKLLLIVVMVYGLSFNCSARKYTKCGLASELESVGMERPDIRNFVCIASVASDYDSEAIKTIEGDYKAYGLFQIHNKFWCDDDIGKNKCNISCSDLLNENLTDDVACIKEIIRERETWDGMGSGLSAWDSYVNVCQRTYMKEFMAECWPVIKTASVEQDPSEQEITNESQVQPSQSQENANESESSQNQGEATDASDSSQSQRETTNGSQPPESQQENANESESSQNQEEATDASDSSQSQRETTNGSQPPESQQENGNESETSQIEGETISESESNQPQRDTTNESQPPQSQENANENESSQNKEETTSESESTQPQQITPNESEISQKDSTPENKKASITNQNRPANADLETADSSVVYMARAPFMQEPLPYVHLMAHPKIYQKTYY